MQALPAAFSPFGAPGGVRFAGIFRAQTYRGALRNLPDGILCSHVHEQFLIVVSKTVVFLLLLPTRLPLRLPTLPR